MVRVLTNQEVRSELKLFTITTTMIKNENVLIATLLEACSVQTAEQSYN